jgi:hypothetical protein
MTVLIEPTHYLLHFSSEADYLKKGIEQLKNAAYVIVGHRITSYQYDATSNTKPDEFDIEFAGFKLKFKMTSLVSGLTPYDINQYESCAIKARVTCFKYYDDFEKAERVGSFTYHFQDNKRVADNFVTDLSVPNGVLVNLQSGGVKIINHFIFEAIEKETLT